MLARGGWADARPIEAAGIAPIFIGFDVETHPIKPGLLAPRLVCLSYAIRLPDGSISTGLVLRDEALRLFRGWLSDPRVILIAHNLTFDVGVMYAEDWSLRDLIYDAFADHRLRCTARRQEVIDVAAGMRKFRRQRGRVTKTTYALVDLLRLYFDEHQDKTDTWQLRYGLLDGVPIARWPPEAVQYAIDDGVDALRIYEAQTAAMLRHFGAELPNQMEQQQATWALHMQSTWGLRAERRATEHFIRTCQREIATMEDALRGTNLLKVNKRTGQIERTATGAPSKSTKEIQARVVASFARLGLPVPMTDPTGKFPQGQVRANTDTLLLTDDAVLHALATASTFMKHLGQWGPVLVAACMRVVCVRYQTLMENGRTSCGGSEGQEGTNIQNPPRKGEVRPCFIPRPGWVFCSSDADTVELRALAFACLAIVGHSRMAEVLRRQAEEGGPDLHVTLAAGIAGIPVEEAHRLHLADDAEFANVRQLAKHVNFALAGGAGAQMFVVMAHGFGICLSQSWATADEARSHARDGEVCPVFSDDSKDERKTITRWVSVSAELARAEQLRQIWFETWPEMRSYFGAIGDMVREQGGTIRQLVSGRVRGDCRFTAAANSMFSGLVADAMKDCCWVLSYESYTGRCWWCRGRGIIKRHNHVDGAGDWVQKCERCGGSGASPLHGSRPVMILHDEPILEHPEAADLRARCERQERTVVWCLQKWMPGIPFSSSYVVTRAWQKSAKRLKDDPAAPVRPERYLGLDGRSKTRWVRDEVIGGGAYPVGAIAS